MLFTDFYELTMAQGYWKQGMNQPAVFEVFFRKNPFNGGFSILAGTGPLIEKILDFSFSDDDLDFLRGQGIFEEGFLAFLKDFRFSGDIWAIDEGSVVFPQEPILRLHAPLIEAQILEGLILNFINFQSLIATKTARVWLAAGKASIMEFGLRRAQGRDGAFSATRAAFIGGAAGTSNTQAAKELGIPAMGTMAHSWILAHKDEEEAFRDFAAIYPDKAVFLIDTYDTLKSGLPNAIKVGTQLAKNGHNFGVRLDSGDIAYLSKEVRKELDKAGFKNATISVSNELDEEIISTLTAANAPIDFWGVGTNMVTGGSESAFTGVYKLAARYDEKSGVLLPTMKISDNPAKTTNPGIKNLYRLFDENGMAGADILTLENEKIEEGKEYTYFHTAVDYRQFKFTASKLQPLLKKVIEGGKRLAAPIPDSKAIKIARKNMETQLATFDPSYQRILNPHVYKVSLSQNLKDLKKAFLESIFD